MRIIIYILIVFALMIIAIMSLKIKIQFVNFKINTLKNIKINKDYKVIFLFYIFDKICIFKKELNQDKILDIYNNEQVVKVFEKEKNKMIKNKDNIEINFLRLLKMLKIELEQVDLKILIGTKDAAITAVLIPIISTSLFLLLQKIIRKINNKQVVRIKPEYINENFINVEFSAVFKIKLIDIIKIIYEINRMIKEEKRKVREKKWEKENRREEKLFNRRVYV